MTEKNLEVEYEYLRETMTCLAVKLDFLGNHFLKSFSDDIVDSAISYGRSTIYLTLSSVIFSLLTDYHFLPSDASKSDISKMVDQDILKATKEVNSILRIPSRLKKDQ